LATFSDLPMSRIALSTTYLPGVHPSSIPDNFQFVDQRGQIYACNIIVARLVSPRVALLLSSDPTIRSIDIEVEKKDDFLLFTSLLRSGTATVCRERLSSSILLARQLGNTELVEQLLSFRPLPSEVDASNIVDDLKFYEEMGENPPIELIRFASENFYRLTEILRHQLKPDTLDQILNQSLVLTTEDQLFTFLQEEIDGEESIDLLRHVEVCCLSEGKYEEFMNHLEPSTLTAGIWSRIRSIRPDRSHRSETHRYERQFGYDGKNFEGIFAHLNRLAGGNCVEKGIIGAEASNTKSGTLSVLFADSDWSGDNFWYQSSVLNGWFKVDFKDRRVSVTDYAIHNSLTHVKEFYFLKTWTLEGSNVDSDSDSDWTKIDSRTDDETLHGSSKVQGHFSCNGDTSHAFRYIRLVQRGTSHHASYYHFLISQFEIFGSLSPPE
jgi:hypothetical protein